MFNSTITPLGGASGSLGRDSALGPGIIGLFIQGIETGMVFSQLATWLSLPGRTEHRFITILTVFITAVGFVQTAISFLSSWRIYVAHSGETVIPTWTERIQLFLTVLAATPVQSLLLWRCYCILNRSVYFIVPLLLLLLGSIAVSIFDTVGLFWGIYSGENPSASHAFWCLLFYSALFSILDIILSSVLFYYLSQSRKQIYADHAVQWISRHIILLWKSAIPPTLCAIANFIIYIVSRHLDPGELQMWFPMLQAVTGKLYVISHFYNINSRPLLEQEQPSAYMTTLTLPALHRTSASVLNCPEERPIPILSDMQTVHNDKASASRVYDVHLEGHHDIVVQDQKLQACP